MHTLVVRSTSYDYCIFIDYLVHHNFSIQTRALKSTYPARCICINLRAVGAVLIRYMYVFVDDLYLRILHEHAESTWLAVGTVDRRGQQKRTICDVRGQELTHTEASFSPISTDSLCLRVAHWVRHLDLEMWRLSLWRRRQRTDGRQTDCLIDWSLHFPFGMALKTQHYNAQNKVHEEDTDTSSRQPVG